MDQVVLALLILLFGSLAMGKNVAVLYITSPSKPIITQVTSHAHAPWVRPRHEQER